MHQLNNCQAAFQSNKFVSTFVSNKEFEMHSMFFQRHLFFSASINSKYWLHFYICVWFESIDWIIGDKIRICRYFLLTQYNDKCVPFFQMNIHWAFINYSIKLHISAKMCVSVIIHKPLEFDLMKWHFNSPFRTLDSMITSRAPLYLFS